MPSSTIPQQLSQLLNSIKAKVKSGLTLPEGFALVQEMIETGMGIVALLNQPGEEKKALLLAYLSDLIDFLITFVVAAITAKMPLMSKMVASWVIPYFVPFFKQAIMAFANAWLEKHYLAKLSVFKPA